MTEPIMNVTCRTCGTEVWRGGHMSITDTEPQGVPFTDGQVLLTGFADVSCPQGGVGCPHTTTALAAAADDQPVTRRELRELRARVDTIDARTRPSPP